LGVVGLHVGATINRRIHVKILVPADDSDMSRHAIELAARMGHEGTAKCTG